MGGQNQSKHSFSDGGISAEIQIRGSILPTSTPACRDIKKNKKKLFSRWEIVFPHISSNQWRRKRKSFYQLFFFLAPSMEVPRLAAISYKRHLMNRLKHGEGIPSSAPTLQGIYRSIHYSDIVGSEEVSNRIKGQPTKVGLHELTSCRKILADTQEATNIYPGVFGMRPSVLVLDC